MGFSTLIDILGATLIGGMLLLILLRLHEANTQNVFTYGSELMVQQNLVSTVELIEHDFRKIGYCQDWKKIPDPTRSIILADTHRISFLTDVNNDGNVDTMRYYLGLPSELTVTPNPRDRMLYRVMNSDTPKGVNLGITQFDLLFFDALGDTIDFPVTETGEIYTMQINVTIENTSAYGDTMYVSAFWRQIRLAARNIRNR